MNWLRSVTLGMVMLAAFPAGAANVSDHWYTPNESGWGIGVTQQDNIAFIVLYLHDGKRQPMWLTGVTTRYGADQSGNPGFAGPLYRTTGPYHGGTFDPATVATVPVGTVTFESTGPDSAVLVYTVDGVQVTKAMQRFTFREKNWTGTYRGVQRANYRNCTSATQLPVIYDDGLIDVEHDGSAFRMWFDGKKAACTYTGTYVQHGRLGTVTGNYTCADGPSGTFKLSGLESHDSAFGGRLDVTHPSCALAWQELAGFNLAGPE